MLVDVLLSFPSWQWSFMDHWSWSLLGHGRNWGYFSCILIDQFACFFCSFSSLLACVFLEPLSSQCCLGLEFMLVNDVFSLEHRRGHLNYGCYYEPESKPGDKTIIQNSMLEMTPLSWGITVHKYTPCSPQLVFCSCFQKLGNS